MLSDAGRDDGLAACDAIDLLDDRVRLDQLRAAVVVHRVRLLERRDVRVPGCEALRTGVFSRGAEGDQPRQCARKITQMMPVDALDLVDLRRIDIELRDEA